MRSLLIEHFLNGYRSERHGRELTAAEQMIVREALESFLVDEQLLHPGTGEELTHIAIVELRRLIPSHGDAPRLVDELEDALKGRAAHIARADNANLILRDHLTMLHNAQALGSRDVTIPRPEDDRSDG